jgi:cytochrome c1
MGRSMKFTLAAALLAATVTASQAQEHEQPTPARQSWSFAGPFGTFDTGQLQRGFKVYREVCQNCHGLTKLAFRNLADEGGPEFSEAQVKALAAEYQVTDGPDDKGEMFQRPGRPSDHFPPNYPNAEAAKAALGAAPPDMSVLAKARSIERGFPWFLIDAVTQYQEQGPDYIYALLNGYTHQDDANYNEYFPGHHIGMPKPLSDGQVEYPDGAPATVQQYAKDVSAFLMWAAEPKLEVRKKTGLRVMAFLILFGGLVLATKRRVWAKIPH